MNMKNSRDESEAMADGHELIPTFHGSDAKNRS